MIKFKTNKKYSTSSICDSNCHFKYEVTRKTAKNVWIKGSQINGIERRKVYIYEGTEIFYPLGQYSMAPSIHATDEVK